MARHLKKAMSALHSVPEPDALDQLATLARRERGALAAVARYEGVNPEDAIDCVQEALCQLLSRVQSGSLPLPSEQWGRYLAGMVRNAARNRRRLHALARPHEAVDSLPLAANIAATDEVLARAEQHVRLRACVADLCEVQRAVVTLRLLEERPGEDVARAVGISAGHVAVLLHRAKASLAACMGT